MTTTAQWLTGLRKPSDNGQNWSKRSLLHTTEAEAKHTRASHLYASFRPRFPSRSSVSRTWEVIPRKQESNNINNNNEKVIFLTAHQ